LIVNADDFGMTAGVNRAVVEACRRGVVTSATVMVNMPGFDEAVRLAAECPELGVGLHFNITQGEPVAGPSRVGSLLNARGLFTGTSTALARRSLLGRLRTEDVAVELRAQLEKALGAGLKLTHLDSHKHAHALPQVFEAVARVLPEAPRLGLGPPKAVKQRAVGLGVARLSRMNLAACRRAGLATTDAFFGVAQTGFWTKRWLADVIEKLPDGVSELMCHPGYEDEGAVPVPTRLGVSRVEEFKLLTDPEIRALIEARGVRLVNFSLLNQKLGERRE
jgi:chitin disaccharide deacetylase